MNTHRAKRRAEETYILTSHIFKNIRDESYLWSALRKTGSGGKGFFSRRKKKSKRNFYTIGSHFLITCGLFFVHGHFFWTFINDRFFVSCFFDHQKSHGIFYIFWSPTTIEPIINARGEIYDGGKVGGKNSSFFLFLGVCVCMNAIYALHRKTSSDTLKLEDKGLR